MKLLTLWIILIALSGCAANSSITQQHCLDHGCVVFIPAQVPSYIMVPPTSI